MQPDKATAANTDRKNARANRTGTIPHNEIAPVLHRLWLIKSFGGRLASLPPTLARRERDGVTVYPMGWLAGWAKRSVPTNRCAPRKMVGTAQSAPLPTLRTKNVDGRVEPGHD